MMMNTGKVDWIPDDFALSAKAVMRMLYAIRDFMIQNHKYLDTHAFSHFVDKFEEEIRNEIDNAPSQVSVIDFQQILEDE